MTHGTISDHTFEVTVPPQLQTLHLTATGESDVTYTVKNTRTIPVRGKLELVPKSGTDINWLIKPQNHERDFRPGEAQQFKVGLKVPKGTAPGTYGFRIDVFNVANSQEDFTEGDVVAFTVEKEKEDITGVGWPKWLIPVIAVVALLVIGGVIAAIVLTRGEKVPKLIGLDLVNANKVVTDAKLVIDKASAGEKAGTEPGIIFEQKPTEGSRLKAGGKVDVTFQDDPKVELKSFKDATIATARPALEAAGFIVTVESKREGTAAPGTILSQKPAAGMVPAKTQVTLSVQAPPEAPTMPQLIGLTLEEAAAKLAAANIPYNKTPIVTPPRAIRPPAVGSVRTQSVAANTAVPPGTTVMLEVEGFPMPNLVGQSVDDARASLRGIGLNVGTVRPRMTKVFLTNPSANTPVLPGTSVDINTSRRPVVNLQDHVHTLDRSFIDAIRRAQNP